MHRLLSLPLFAALLLNAACSGTPERPVEAAGESGDVPPAAEAPPPAAQQVRLKPDYPRRYTVVKGDTLWDIAEMFLHDPWRWPEVWQKNPQVANPHLIYPGDVLILVYIDGRPVIQVQRDGEVARVMPTVKLSPQIREGAIEEAIPTISSDAIRPFLNRPRVLSEEELETTPYIATSPDEHLIIGAGNRIYVRKLTRTDIGRYVVVRRGKPYIDPDSDEILGYEAIYVGEARVQRFGDPATLIMTASKREVLPGDHLIPEGDDLIDQSYFPRPPEEPVKGRLIHVVDGVARIGQFQVVVLNRGRQDGLERGHVLAVWQAGKAFRDRYAAGWDKDITLPDERAGVVMVFRVFEQVSYALVMKATRPMHVLDRVSNP